MSVPIRCAIWTTCQMCRGRCRSSTRCRIVSDLAARTGRWCLRGIAKIDAETRRKRRRSKSDVLRVFLRVSASPRQESLHMKIVVAVKQVPARDSQLHIVSSGKWIEESALTYEINEPDAYALEA